MLPNLLIALMMPLVDVPDADSIGAEVVLREVSVAAQRKLGDTGVEKTVLDTTKLHRHVANSLADVLTEQTTLFVKSYGRGTESTAEFRGTSASHTQVVWNGMKINSPMLGTVDFSYIPSYFVDQATLLHGASSLNLTGGGLGGAIELSTKPDFTTKGWKGMAVQGVGSYKTVDDYLRLDYTTERWSSSTRVAYGHAKNDYEYLNRDKMVDERDEWGTIVSSYHPREKNKSGYFDDVNAMHDIHYRDERGNTLGASVWYGYSLRGLPFLSVDYRDEAEFCNEHREETWRSVVSWDHKRRLYTLGVKGGYSSQDIAYDYTTTRQTQQTDITHSRSRAQTGFTTVEANYYPLSNLMMTATVGGRYAKVRSRDKSPFHIGDNYNKGRGEWDAALTVRYRPWQRVSLSALVRGEGYGSEVVPVIPAGFVDVVIYKPWNLVVKASVARNYRYPSMDDLYFQPGGNPDLKPEHGFTYDGGLEWDTKGRRVRVKGNVTAYDSRIKDWILWTPNAKGFWVPSNVRRVHNYGLETMHDVEVKLGRQWLAACTMNYAFTPSINEGKGVNSSDASRGKQLCYVPRHSANIGVRLEWQGWRLNYSWVYYSERFTTTSNETQYITGRIQPYFMSNAMLEKRLPLRRVELGLKAVVRNLLGTEYVTVLSRPMPGRNFEGFVEVRF